MPEPPSTQGSPVEFVAVGRRWGLVRRTDPLYLPWIVEHDERGPVPVAQACSRDDGDLAAELVRDANAARELKRQRHTLREALGALVSWWADRADKDEPWGPEFKEALCALDATERSPEVSP